MKVWCFIFKFVDHDSRNCIIIEIHVRCNEADEWEFWEQHGLENHPEVLNAQRHRLWEMRLMKKVEEIVRKNYFQGNGGFSAFKLCRERTSKEIEKVNLNAMKDTDEQKFRKTKVIEMCCLKYVKGRSPQNWADIYNYSMTNHFEVHHLKSNVNDDKIVLEELCRPITVPKGRERLGTQVTGMASRIGERMRDFPFKGKTLPPEKEVEEQKPEETSETSIPDVVQKGGYNMYHNKYKKYKKKYVNLKRGFPNY